MKPIHIFLLIIAAAAFAVSYAVWRRNKAATTTNGNGTNKAVQGLLATVSTTTVIDPVSGQEYIISQAGENALDQGAGTAQMKSNLAQIIQTIESELGSSPAKLTIKTYGPDGQLMGSTDINNPFNANLVTAQGADPIPGGLEGELLYSCPSGTILHGPNYYKSATGESLFGMFCN